MRFSTYAWSLLTLGSLLAGVAHAATFECSDERGACKVTYDEKGHSLRCSCASGELGAADGGFGAPVSEAEAEKICARELASCEATEMPNGGEGNTHDSDDWGGQSTSDSGTGGQPGGSTSGGNAATPPNEPDDGDDGSTSGDNKEESGGCSLAGRPSPESTSSWFGLAAFGAFVLTRRAARRVTPAPVRVARQEPR